MSKRVLIDITNIKKYYKVGTVIVKALEGVSLKIFENEYVAIMGPSGSGKSTLMNLLGCLDTPTEGQYVLNGTDVSKLEDDRLAEIRNNEIGFVFQTFNLLPRYTALENVMLPLIYAGIGKIERQKMAEQTLANVSLDDRMLHKPNELSGGQRQRVALARALVNNPSIILADEPTGNLDSRTSLEIIELFQRLNSDGLTILMVTHEPDIAHFANRIVILRDGLIQTDKLVKRRSAAKELTTWVDESEALSASEANS